MDRGMREEQSGQERGMSRVDKGRRDEQSGWRKGGNEQGGQRDEG